MAQHGLKSGDLLRIATFRREIPVAGVGRFLVREGTGSGSTVSWEALVRRWESRALALGSSRFRIKDVRSE